MISHGNGPQVGLLSLQASAYDEESTYPFDVLGAQTEGMIGYFIEQELGNLLPFEKPIATILTMTEVDPDDPAMKDPTKFVGPVYTEEDAQRLAAEKGWTVKPDGDNWRRVVPSPLPAADLRDPADQAAAGRRARSSSAPAAAASRRCTCQGSTRRRRDRNPRTLVGVEAVIDKDRSSAVLAQDLDADLLVIATDADAVYLDWGTPDQRAIAQASPDADRGLRLPGRVDGSEGRGGGGLRPLEARQGRGHRRPRRPDRRSSPARRAPG